MHRDAITTAISALLLCGAMLLWQDLFLFSKVVHLPSWTDHLPRPINTAAYLAFVCLMPVALATTTLVRAVCAQTLVLVVAPLPAVALYAASREPGSNFELLANTSFQYLWMVGFHCLVPAVILLAVRFVARTVRRVVSG